MAYELSSSIGSDKSVPHTFVEARVSTNTRGAFPNSQGTKIAGISFRHGGASSTDNGIDIWKSGSSGWYEYESIDTGGSRPRTLLWFSDSEILAIQGDNKVHSYVSSSVSGWTTNYTSTSQASNAYHLRLSPNKTKLSVVPNFQTDASSNMDDTAVMYIYESSSSGFIENNSYTAHGGKITGVTFVNETNIIIGQPYYNSQDGRIQHIQYDGSSWSHVRSCLGHSGGANSTKQFGWSTYWHTPSNSLLVGAAGTANLFRMWVIPSQSSGYIPSSNPHNATGAEMVSNQNILDSSRVDGFTPTNAYVASGVSLFSSNNESRLAGMTLPNVSHDDGRVFFTLESGSSGWKFNQFEDNGGNDGTETRGIGQNIASGNSSIFVGWVTGSVVGAPEGFTVYRLLSSGNSGGGGSGGGGSGGGGSGGGGSNGDDPRDCSAESSECKLISPDYIINFYGCAKSQYTIKNNGKCGVIPFRLSSHGVFNIRGQSVSNHYKTFIGEHKS